MQLSARPLVLAALLLSPACLENEEEITVRPDGSVHVRVSAKGDLADLAEGYPVPLGAPWRPVGEHAQEWLAQVGATTGGAETLRKVEESHVLGDDLSVELRLEVERDFASVAELPSSYADPQDPYAAAYLSRSTRLKTSERDGRTVYVFERTFHARPYGLVLFERMLEDEMDTHEELFDKVESGSVTEDDWRKIANVVRDWHVPLARQFALESFQAHYERGSATIPAATVRTVIERLAQQMNVVFSVERLQVFTGEDEDDAVLWMGIWNDFRASIRAVLGEELERSGLAREEQYAILFELEREFTEYDHTADLGDESFHLTVHLPGEIVTGNFDSLEDGAARWQIDGTDLFVGDRTLRAISVLD